MNWYKISQQQELEFIKNMPKQIRPNMEGSKEYQDLVKKSNINLEEALEYNVHNYDELVKLLNTYRVSWKQIDFPKADSIITLEYDGQNYLIDDFNNPELKDPREWIYGIYDHYLDDYVPTQDFNDIFWNDVGNGSVVYHATSEENKDSILKNGLSVMDKTRGISNKSTGNAIFCSDNSDDISSYGDIVFEINLGKMKNDGYMPNVSKEEPIETSTQRQALANKIGIDDIDFSEEYASEGLYETTVIFYDNIPAKYLRVL